MPEMIEATVEKRIARPLAIVSAQFLDFEHHVRKNVHPDLKITILEQQKERARVRVEARLAGMRQIDEWQVTRQADGGVLTEFVAGPNAGGGIRVRFEADGASATRVFACAFVPKQGIKRLLAPVFRAALRKIGEAALEEDRIDLEGGGYDAVASGERIGA